MLDIVERLRVRPEVITIHQMMIEREEAATAIEMARKERDEFSVDLRMLREAIRVRPSKKAMIVIRDTLEALTAMDDPEAPVLRLLVEMYDRVMDICGGNPK